MLSVPILFRPIFTRAFVFLYLLGIASGLITVPNYRGAHMYENAPMELFLDVYVVCALICLIPKRMRLMVLCVLYAFAYPLYLIDTFCFVKFGTTLNPSMLLLMGETNAGEAGEFFSSYVTPDLLTSPVMWIVGIAVLHIACAVGWKRVKMPEMPVVQMSQGRKWLWHVAGSLPVVAMLAWTSVDSIANKRMYCNTMTRETIGEVEHDMAERPHAEIYQPPMRLAFAIRGNQLIAQQLNQLRATTEHVQIDSCTVKSPEIVLIIGESFNRRHAQLYGYTKPNMPNQVMMEKQGRLTKLNDVVSPWNLTSFVFKHLMTTYAVGDEKDWCNYPLFCQVFREAGYQVNFFTNQFLPKAKEEVYDFSGGFFINDPELSRKQFDVRNEALHVFDEGLLKDFERELPDSMRAHVTKPQLHIFHLMGQHVSYRVRSPRSKKKWGTGDYTENNDLTPKLQKVLAEYDNAVWYNDSVVNQIVERFKKDEAVVIYLSDHGEEVFGPGMRKKFGRMHNATIDKRLADEEFRIPMWIYTTPLYDQRHPEVKQAIREAADKPYMTDALSHLLLGLAGIHCPYYKPQYDLLSPMYDTKRPRLLKHSVDYDKL